MTLNARQRKQVASGRITDAAEVMTEQTLNLIKHILLKLETAQLEVMAEMKEEIESLRQQLETERMRLAACGTAALGYFNGCADKYKSASLDDVLRLRQQLAECERDAERYRWLRDQELPDIQDCYHQHPDRFDEAVDAALAKVGGGVTGEK